MAPTVDLGVVEAATAAVDRVALGADQDEALIAIAASGRIVDLLIGPAGAGKTTAMRALRAAWETQHGPGSVVGLAPSATAAAVLGGDLGIATENTAKWLADHDRCGAAFREGQLVIVDEASLAGTFTLDRIAGLAAEAGAKVLLAGDWAQLQAVEAGGAFSLLAADRDDAPELFDIHRFRHDWEKAASLGLRHGHVEAIDAYQAHGCAHDGDSETMHDAAYAAWRQDLAAGLSSALVADDRRTVAALNARAREDRIRTGVVDPGRSIGLAEGTSASVGDLVITRRNDRRLTAGKTGWVRNGDRWTVTAIHDDGSVAARRAGYTRGATVVLPTAYAAERLDLGYAVTGHGAQGVTVETAHVIATSRTARENLYVALTRGREANRLRRHRHRPG
jgi:ATP-dependent exoDNAse (exonuclease V) alpha subunit